ncbi:hypothetical protein [Rhizobium sp. P44RR-XXIV]|uniref:hypothetical protein n=1 Tax=Rhizobium sp. P44RR-XXIV TaxID=1921145 RepID=UPI0010AAE2C1|nr:hypothetical protein [Rhizobium sp. P44RR-XXIV]TIX87685.1 hypothetical protein BSK43_033055 [Rhizobium sp. P44RR-XXIV]
MAIDEHRFRQEHQQFLKSLIFTSRPVLSLRGNREERSSVERIIGSCITSIQNGFDEGDVKRPELARKRSFSVATAPFEGCYRMKVLLSPKNAIALGCRAHIVNPVSGSDGSGWQPGEE